MSVKKDENVSCIWSIHWLPKQKLPVMTQT